MRDVYRFELLWWPKKERKEGGGEVGGGGGGEARTWWIGNGPPKEERSIGEREREREREQERKKPVNLVNLGRSFFPFSSLPPPLDSFLSLLHSSLSLSHTHSCVCWRPTPDEASLSSSTSFTARPHFLPPPPPVGASLFLEGGNGIRRELGPHDCLLLLPPSDAKTPLTRGGGKGVR